MALPGSPSPTSEPFGQRTPWSAGAAAFFTILTLAFAIGVAGMAQPLHNSLGHWIGGNRPDVGVLANSMLTLIVLQCVVLAMVWWASARFGAERWRLLSLQAFPSLSALGVGLAGMAALLAPYNLFIYLIAPDHFAADLRPFWDLARSPAVWLAVLAVVIGAPMTEELLFRGFLLPALTKTKYGFQGAALLSTAGWTALHFYSLPGLIEVFMIGLYFAWLTHRYGTLWLPIMLHALYNGLQLLVLALWPAA